MKRAPLTVIASFVACSLALSLAPSASAETASLFAGAGPRFASGDTLGVGALRLDVDVESMLRVGFELNGYLSGAGDEGRALDLAGGQVLLMAAIPLPGPVTPELGAGVGWVSLDEARHGVDDSFFTVNVELALRASLGPAALRVAWTRPVWTRHRDMVDRGLESQLMFSVGVGF
ncbi:MAG: hypothetical protein KC635_28815 [Myxococcales bacterium]|nr:hypothetical protein [Myxococcales bacterium]MCB9733802.1 hypothetical protein [Deltaproteobacteria bacterium]